MYDITGVWVTTSALLNGVEQLAGTTDLTYIWDNGELGSEQIVSGTLVSYSLGSATLVAGDPNILTWSGNFYPEPSSTVGIPMTLDVSIDKLTNANNMTWRDVNYPNTGDTYVKTLVKSSTISLSDW